MMMMMAAWQAFEGAFHNHPQQVRQQRIHQPDQLPIVESRTHKEVSFDLTGERDNGTEFFFSFK